MIWNFIFILLFTSTAHAEEGLTLQAAVDELLGSNADIRAAKAESDAAKARIGSAKALDDPQVGVMFDDVPISTANPQQAEEIDYRVEQKLPFPGKRYLRGKAARHDAEAASQAAAAKTADVVLDVKKTYYELYRIDRQLQINRENQRLLEGLLASAKIRYATNQTTADAPLKAQVEISLLKNEVTLLTAERMSHEAHMKALLGRRRHDVILLPEHIEWPKLSQKPDEILELTRASRPELNLLQAAERREKVKVLAAKQGLLPDVTLAFQYGDRPMSENTWTSSAMINLPVFFWGKNRSEIREAKAMLRATQAMRESMLIHSEHDIEQALASFDAAEKTVAAYKNEILPQAKATLHSAETAYATSRIDFLTLIDAARTTRMLEMSFYAQQAQLGSSFAELERLVGIDLEEK
ncbi:MAG: TolC family protein [Deltaproteobacteria bacterium]|nr:TolC family protein [Deltaproteobacteria bacterium]